MALTFKESLAYFWQQIVAQFVRKENGKGLSSNDFTTEEKEKLASAVLSVNGVEPDENGEIKSDYVFKDRFMNMGFQVMSFKSPSIYYDVLSQGGARCNFSFEYTDLINDDGKNIYYHTHITTSRSATGGMVYTIHFGDYAPPVIVDVDANTITLDPNWVAPAEPITEWVQSDWNESDETNKAFIKNKPELATDDDMLALMMEVDALPVVMDESGAIMTDEEGAILLA